MKHKIIYYAHHNLCTKCTYIPQLHVSAHFRPYITHLVIKVPQSLGYTKQTEDGLK